MRRKEKKEREKERENKEYPLRGVNVEHPFFQKTPFLRPLIILILYANIQISLLFG